MLNCLAMNASSTKWINDNLGISKMFLKGSSFHLLTSNKLACVFDMSATIVVSELIDLTSNPFLFQNVVPCRQIAAKHFKIQIKTLLLEMTLIIRNMSSCCGCTLQNCCRQQLSKLSIEFLAKCLLRMRQWNQRSPPEHTFWMEQALCHNHPKNVVVVLAVNMHQLQCPLQSDRCSLGT